MSLRLIIEDDEGTTTVVPLGADAITIGRQQGNTIQLTEKNVSRRHARLYPDQETWIVEDLGSYNGVKVNAQKVEGRVVLQEGDVIQIGDYHLALTENVDRRTLNFDRPPEAANDVEPLLVSSSTDLPRLSPEELAQLSSGPHTPQPAPAMLDSGPVPAVSSPHYAREQKSGSGLLVGVGVVVAVALVLGGAWLVTSGNAPPETQVAEATKPPAAAVQDDAPEPTPADDEPPAVVEPEDSSAEGAEDVPEDEAEDAGVVDDPTTDHGEEAVAIEVETPEPRPEARTPKTSTKSSTKSSTSRSKKPSSSSSSSSSSSDTPPKPPPAPAVDADQLLADARKASMSNQLAKAYDLARKAYKEKPSQDALNVMATAACKMGDASKAKFAIGKLSGKRKEDAKKLCEIKGVSI